MAKRPNARQRARTHARVPPPRGLIFTPDLLADVRRRYEETDEPVPSIAAECGAHRASLYRLAEREGWVRFKPPPRDLSPSAKLAREAEGLVDGQGALPPPERGRVGVGVIGDSQGTPTRPPSAVDLPLSGGGKEEALSGGGNGEAARMEGGVQSAATPALISRLRAQADHQLAEAEAMRDLLKTQPQRREDRERNSRTLLNLTTVIERIHRLEAGRPLPTSGQPYDDTPADLDAFREQLARRIDALFASGEGEGADAPPDGA